MKSSARLTASEASFLALERPGFPMHVAALVIFDGHRPIEMNELAQLVAERLRRASRFHRRVRYPFGGAWPMWEPGGRIKLSSHLFHHHLLPPGRMSELRDLCARIHEQPLDRDRPLWQMHLIDGLSGRRQALLIKAHHAITDGIAGMEMGEMLFDPAPDAPEPQVPVMRFMESPARWPWNSLQALVGLAFTAAGGPMAVEGPFNGRVSGERAFGAASLPMAVVRRVRRQLGVSIDDVLMATVAAGLSSYLRGVGYPGVPRSLRAMVPVSTRGQVCDTRQTNQVSAIFIDLPMDLDDRTAIVRRIAKSKATLRAAHAAAGSELMVEAAARLPAPLHSSVLRIASGLPFANLVVSDVPGPNQDLFVLGRRITSCYPLMPLAPDVGLSIAMVSMAGKVWIGVTADPSLVPDVQQLATAIEAAFTAFESPKRSAA